MEMPSALEDCADAWPTSTSMAPYAVRLGTQNWSTASLFEENKVPQKWFFYHLAVRKKRLGSICDGEGQCLDENAHCEDGICRCYPEFYEDRTGICSEYLKNSQTLEFLGRLGTPANLIY